MIDKNSTNSVDFQEGEIVLIDKDIGHTSFSAVKQLRYFLKKKYNYDKLKVGHSGTLDPLATGLLIICTGKATKTIDVIQNGNKEYIAEVMLGATTPSLDAETEINEKFKINHISEELIKQSLIKFTGEIEQIPPIYSAIRVDGVRSYHNARKGKNIEPKSRKVIIHEIELLDIEMPIIKLRIFCGKGTYIRSLARDIGKQLDSGAYLRGLRRIKIGKYNVENSLTISEFKNKLNLL